MRTILCIDDDARSLFIRSKILEQHGYRVLAASSGEEGLRLFSRETVDAVVLDYYMPAMSGAEVAWELKRRGSGTPVLLLSSAVFCPDNASDLVDAFCAKIDGPVTFLELLRDLVEAANTAGGAARRSVLVVDDNDLHRYAVARLLRRAGFNVMEASGGQEALDQVRRITPDLVLLDVNMPDLDGFEVCRRIKSDPATARIPVLHLTATPSSTATAQDGAAAGADGYLVQPTPPEELIATVTALIEHRHGS